MKGQQQTVFGGTAVPNSLVMITAAITSADGLMRFPLVYLHAELEELAGTDICFTSSKPKNGDGVVLTILGEKLVVIAREHQTKMGRETRLELPEQDAQEFRGYSQPGAFITDLTPIGRLMYKRS